MDLNSSNQLEKILALADSSFDAEAVVAVRKAREILSRDGLSFSDLARIAGRRAGFPRGFPIFAAPRAQLETLLSKLQRELGEMQAAVEAKTAAAHFWQMRAAEFEQNLNISRAEADRWRQLARDTVDKLWGLGEEVRSVDSPAVQVGDGGKDGPPLNTNRG